MKRHNQKLTVSGILQKMLPMVTLPTMYSGWWWSFKSSGCKIPPMTLSEIDLRTIFDMTWHCFFNWPLEILIGKLSMFFYSFLFVSFAFFSSSVKELLITIFIQLCNLQSYIFTALCSYVHYNFESFLLQQKIIWHIAMYNTCTVHICPLTLSITESAIHKLTLAYRQIIND